MAIPLSLIDVYKRQLLVSARGPLLLEVNSSPGLEGIERATGADVAGAIVAYVEKAARRSRR